MNTFIGTIIEKRTTNSILGYKIVSGNSDIFEINLIYVINKDSGKRLITTSSVDKIKLRDFNNEYKIVFDL